VATKIFKTLSFPTCYTIKLKIKIMTNEDLNTTITNIKEAWKYPELFENVSKSERWLSGAAGTYLLYKGLTSLFSHPVIALTGAAVGAGLLYRGITGYCPMRDLAEQKKEKDLEDEILVSETFVVSDLA
jgi:uncharacterized membrane protein